MKTINKDNKKTLKNLFNSSLFLFDKTIKIQIKFHINISQCALFVFQKSDIKEDIEKKVDINDRAIIKIKIIG
jgi:hypothetical protein